MPIGGPLLEELIIHPFIIQEYMISLFGKHMNNNELGEERLALMRELYSKHILAAHKEVEDFVEWVRVRKFNSLGEYDYYYGSSFHGTDVHYSFWNDEPVLIAILPQRWLNEERHLETGWITRPEVRLLAALSFSTPSLYGPSCYFSLSESYDFPSNFVFPESRELTKTAVARLQIGISILQRLRSNNATTSKIVYKNKSPYKFRTKDLVPENTVRFFDCFDVNDNLTLRTAFCLLKSAMLWSYGARSRSHIFSEDSVANMFFGLEGCLRLIHRRISDTKNFAINPTLRHIEKVFPEKPGYLDMITYSYEQRVEIVHPEPNTNREWTPFITSDDFYENYGMAIDLIYYAVTGETFTAN